MRAKKSKQTERAKKMINVNRDTKGLVEYTIMIGESV